MQNYVYLMDTNADLPADIISENDMQLIKFQYVADDIAYDDIETEAECKDFYKKMREGRVTRTVQITVDALTPILRPYLEQGQNIFYLAFTSGLSGTYDSALMTRENLLKEYPDRKIVILDSFAASIGEGLLAYLGAKKRLEGATLEELTEYMKQQINMLELWFTVDDLQFLRRGGRLSSSSAFVGSMLNIKPVLECNGAGKLVPREKVRGRKKALNGLVDKVELYGGDMKGKVVGISHGDCIEDLNYVKQQIQERFGVTDFITNYIGAVIGSHSGPGTIALGFIGKDARPKP